ncbi:MAG: MBL fold metallo-hydrolase [Alphaproteobacteria bacterium]|nr:MBL fold metallo-hydrolase [Alphaproteobacteria bacterium]
MKNSTKNYFSKPSVKPSIQCLIVPVTRLQQNCTLIGCLKTNECAVIDPGGDVENILRAAQQYNLEIKKIWITHGHFDHCGGAQTLKEETGAIIEGPHKADEKKIKHNILRHAYLYNLPDLTPFKPDRWLEDGDTVTVGETTWQVLHCPGHTPGHVVFYNKANNFAAIGDILKENSTVRSFATDSNTKELVRSITQKLWPLGNVEYVAGYGNPSNFFHARQRNIRVNDKRLGYGDEKAKSLEEPSPA